MFFYLKVLYDTMLTFDNGKIGWPRTSKIVVIHFSNTKARSEDCLGLGVNNFLAYLIEAFQFGILMF